MKKFYKSNWFIISIWCITFVFAIAILGYFLFNTAINDEKVQHLKYDYPDAKKSTVTVIAIEDMVNSLKRIEKKLQSIGERQLLMIKRNRNLAEGLRQTAKQIDALYQKLKSRIDNEKNE